MLAVVMMVAMTPELTMARHGFAGVLGPRPCGSPTSTTGSDHPCSQTAGCELAGRGWEQQSGYPWYILGTVALGIVGLHETFWCSNEVLWMGW